MVIKEEKCIVAGFSGHVYEAMDLDQYKDDNDFILARDCTIFDGENKTEVISKVYISKSNIAHLYLKD